MLLKWIRARVRHKTQSSRFRWSAAVVLGIFGYALNLLPVGLSPGTDLIFGGVAYLLAAVALGPGPGMLSAGLASARTLWLWNHPYAWLIFTAEAGVVGLLNRRWGQRLMISDLLYWLLCGLPLLFFTYTFLLKVTGYTASVIFLKQPLNGLIDALLVEMLLMMPAVRQVLRLPGAPRLQVSLAVVVSTAAIVPALVFGIWIGRREWGRNLERAHDRVELAAQAHASKLEQYIMLHERAVRSVAQAAERRGSLEPEALQRLVTAEHDQFPGFINVYAADSRGRTVAFHPLTNARGDTLLGLDFSDRSYFQAVRRTRETVLSGVFPGRGGTTQPLVVIAHPIIHADTFAGYVLGALDLEGLPRPSLPPRGTERLRVADARGSMVFDSEEPSEPRWTRADSLAFARVRATGGSGTTIYAPGQARAAPAVTASQVLAGVASIPSLGWWVWVEQPFREIQMYAAEAYVRLFSLLIAVMLLSLLVSTALARHLARPLLRLRAAAGSLAAGNVRARVGPLPGSTPAEVSELGRGFDEMADALSGRTRELEELGEIARSLASTLNLQELLRRITDATTRLIDADGCGLALLETGKETTRIADYSTGLLGEIAGKSLPLHSSLVGWAVRTGEPVLVPDAAEDPRVAHDRLSPGAIRSVICAPLVGRSGTLGALLAVRGHSRPQSFTPSELKLLERLAGNAAVAVENARLLDAAETASRAKSDFIATMSHELRTPLNAVLGHLELLEFGVHGELTPAQRSALGRINTATRHLRGLIEEVLSFSQLEAGRVEIREAEVDLCALAREVATVMEPLAHEKGLAFQTSCDGSESLLVRSDPDKIRQILINLAGNAVKFTEQGEVRIDVSMQQDAARVVVCDTGIGISSEDQSRLFQPFEQLHSGLSRPHGGTGLGLYLSGQYARLLGGHIEVESRAGEGSTFALLLPFSGVGDTSVALEPERTGPSLPPPLKRGKRGPDSGQRSSAESQPEEAESGAQSQ